MVLELEYTKFCIVIQQGSKADRQDISDKLTTLIGMVEFERSMRKEID